MKRLPLALLVLCSSTLLFADDDRSEIYSCSFIAHTPAGTMSGNCTTQSLQTPGFISRWILTLIPDEQNASVAAKIKPDQFYDIVRGQCFEDGTFSTVIPLWGDFVVSPIDPDYIRGNKACAPIYQTLPNIVTVSQTNLTPLTFQFLFEERPADYDSAEGYPTVDWIIHYLESFHRLGSNVVNGH